MEMLFVVLGGILVGLGLRYVLPGRAVYGSALLPAVSGSVTAAVWAALTWLDWRFDGGWIWVVSLVAGGLAAVPAAVLLARRREAADERMLEALSKP